MNSPNSVETNRRQFLGAAALAAGSAPFLLGGGGTCAGETGRRPRVAAIYTVCRHRARPCHSGELPVTVSLQRQDHAAGRRGRVDLCRSDFPEEGCRPDRKHDPPVQVAPLQDDRGSPHSRRQGPGRRCGPVASASTAIIRPAASGVRGVPAQTLLRRDRRRHAPRQSLCADLQRQASVLSLGLGPARCSTPAKRTASRSWPEVRCRC